MNASQAGAICPRWCQRQHDVRDARMVRHAATVAERQIGNVLVTVAVHLTVRADGNQGIGPTVAISVQDGAHADQLDATLGDTRTLAELLQLADAGGWLVDALTAAVDLAETDPSTIDRGPQDGRGPTDRGNR